MLGKLDLRLWNRKLRYEFTIERQITVIKGNSGTGKTTFFEMVQDAISGGKGVHCNISDKLVTLPDRVNLDHYRDLHNKIFVFDESQRFILERDFANFVNYSDNYFIFITRAGIMDWLTYSVNDIYELQTQQDSTGNYITRLYNLYSDSPVSISPDLILTEDSGAGNQMFSLLYGDERVKSAYGKDNVYNRLNELQFEKAYVIVDGAGFGNCIGRILKSFGDKINIFAPESFEYLLLNTSKLKRFLTTELDCTYNFCDTTKFISWERYYTSLLKIISTEHLRIKYDKGDLPEVFKSDYFINEVSNQVPDSII